jgi:hypothetical protein
VHKLLTAKEEIKQVRKVVIEDDEVPEPEVKPTVASKK